MDLIESLQAQLMAVQREFARPEHQANHLEQSLSSLETSMHQGCATVAEEGSLDGQIAAARLEATRLHKYAARRRVQHENELNLLRGKLAALKAERAAERVERPVKQAPVEPSVYVEKRAGKKATQKVHSVNRFRPDVQLMRRSQLATFYGCEADSYASNSETAHRSPQPVGQQDSLGDESAEFVEPAFADQRKPAIAEAGRPAPNAQFRNALAAQWPLLKDVYLAYNSALFFAPNHVLCAYTGDQPPAACASFESGIFRANAELQLLHGANAYIALFECRVIDLCGCCFGDVFIDVFAGCELIDLSGASAASIRLCGKAAFVRIDEDFKGALDGQIGRVIVTATPQ